MSEYFLYFKGRLLFPIASQTLFLKTNFYLIAFQLTTAFFFFSADLIISQF